MGSVESVQHQDLRAGHTNIRVCQVVAQDSRGLGIMTNLFGVVMPFLAFGAKGKDEKTAKIDTFTCRLHFRYTSGFLFLATALLALNDIFGKEIQCFDQNRKSSPKVVDQYCFVTGTFTIPGRLDRRIMEDDGCDAGRGMELQWDQDGAVSMEKNTNNRELPRCKRVHNYYQWVPYILVLQGVLFLLPHYFWMSLEGDKMETISNEVNTKDDQKNNVISNVAKFIHIENHTSSHKRYAIFFLLYQFLKVLNVVINVIILNVFFDGRFVYFGPRYMRDLDTMDLHSVLPDVFPRMTACTWHQFSSGGGPETQNHLCILATNIATEKVFVFLWFWYLILLVTSLGSFLYYSYLLFTRDVNWKLYFLNMDTAKDLGDGGGMTENSCRMYVKEMSLGQFFLLYMFGKEH